MARIAFLIPNLGGGGAERVAVTLVGALAERGHEVDLVVMQKRGALLDEVHPNVRIIDLQVSRTRKVILPLLRYLRNRRPDVLQVSMWPLTVAGIIASRLCGYRVRCVVSDHAVMSDHYGPAQHRTIGASVRLFYPLASARVSVSEGAANDLAKLSGTALDWFTIIPNPIGFPAQLESSPETEAMWGQAASRILTVGALKEEKNQALLIRSLARVPGAVLVIAGEGELRAKLEELAINEGVADRVVIAGFLTDPWPLYASADLFVLSSREESFGNVLVEALYAGLPIVSTPTVGARSVLEQGRWGRLVASSDPVEFANAMAQELQHAADGSVLRRRAVELSGVGSVDAYERILLPAEGQLDQPTLTRSRSSRD